MMHSTETSTTSSSDRRWPELRASDPDPCDGVHPQTGQPCTLGHHSGCHRSTSGAEWLDR
jgi:hypothetical protein